MEVGKIAIERGEIEWGRKCDSSECFARGGSDIALVVLELSRADTHILGQSSTVLIAR